MFQRRRRPQDRSDHVAKLLKDIGILNMERIPPLIGLLTILEEYLHNEYYEILYLAIHEQSHGNIPQNRFLNQLCYSSQRVMFHSRISSEHLNPTIHQIHISSQLAESHSPY